ncbi:hypothetical protein [Bifidobacterium simiarum]|uniref:hypothetical protein n=1 Tax=Bifidobacterium simiarum TaxID=2045441 RepID=UPI001BDCBA5A|nr:hypothetical protein [Bifidobacterium simiarum]MBT1167250.1 hypothetical protein [Bifidobacterium simiarum]
MKGHYWVGIRFDEHPPRGDEAIRALATIRFHQPHENGPLFADTECEIEPWAAPVARRIGHGLVHLADDIDETRGRSEPDHAALYRHAWLRPLGDGNLPDPEGCVAALDIGETMGYLLAQPARDPDTLTGIMIAAATFAKAIGRRYGIEPCDTETGKKGDRP